MRVTLSFKRFPDNKLPKPAKSKQRETVEDTDREDRIDKRKPKPGKLKPIPKLPSPVIASTTTKPTKSAPSKSTKANAKEKPKPQFRPLSKPQPEKAEPVKPKADKRKSDDEGTLN